MTTDTKAIRALLAKMTPGPWVPERYRGVTNPWFDAHPVGRPIESRGTVFGLGVAVAVTAEERDQTAIATGMNALPALLDELDEARATLANERGEGEPPGGRWFWTHNAWNARGEVGGLVTRDDPTWDARRQRWLPNTWTLSMRGRTDTTHPTARAAMRAALEATKEKA